MANPKIFTVEVFANLPATFLARLEDLATGALVTQASLSAISYRIFDISGTAPDRYLSGGTVAIATTISNHLKVDNRWHRDGVGFNFAHTQPGTAFPLGPTTLLLEYAFTPVGATAPAYGLFYSLRVLQTRSAGAIAGTTEGMGTGPYQAEPAGGSQ
jgi:hypothetical protein